MESVLKAGKWCAYASAFVLGLSAMAVRIPAQAVANGGANSIQALFVSDIHFEPFRDPGKAAQLAAAPVEEWNAILAAPASADAAAQWTKLEQACPTRGADTSYALYQSSLHAIHAQAGEAKFAIVERRLDCAQLLLQIRRSISQKLTPARVQGLCGEDDRLRAGELARGASRGSRLCGAGK